MASSETIPTNDKKAVRLIVAAIVVGCLAVFGQVARFQFLNYDDNLYVYENVFVLSGVNGESITWAFTTFHSANWHPLTWLSHMLDATLFGADPGWHHFVNVILHTANSVLAFFVFKDLTRDLWKSALVAILFAVHPAHVESVAWVAERKDVLSTLFWLLTMFFYARFAAGSAAEAPAIRRWLAPAMVLAIFAFVLGLMSKPMLVTVPFVLLLIDYWPLGRLRNAGDLKLLLLEKLPFFVLSAASSYITVKAQAWGGAIQSLQVIPADARVLNAIVSYGKYVGMLFYPADLGVGYAYTYPIPVWQIIGSSILLAGVTVVCFWQRRERKYLLAGWLWFLGTMVPVIGLVQVGAQSMADRYTYVPYFGLFVMLVWGIGDLLYGVKLNFASKAVAVSVPVLILAGLAFNQTAKWKDAETLYRHSLNSGYGNFSIMLNYCNVLMIENRLAEAESQCRNSIEADPGFPHAYVSLGVINVKNGKFEEAVANFSKAKELKPSDPMATANLAAPLAVLGRTDEAEENLARASELYRRAGLNESGLSTLYFNLAAAFAKQSRFDRAEAMLRRVLEVTPQRADARANLALSLYFQGKLDEAKSAANAAIAQNPALAESYNILGMVLLAQGERDQAIAQFERALVLKPDFNDARVNLDKANAGK